MDANNYLALCKRVLDLVLTERELMQELAQMTPDEDPFDLRSIVLGPDAERVEIPLWAVSMVAEDAMAESREIAKAIEAESESVEDIPSTEPETKPRARKSSKKSRAKQGELTSRIIESLTTNPGQTVKGLASALGKNENTVRVTVDRLREQGRLYTEPDPEAPERGPGKGYVTLEDLMAEMDERSRWYWLRPSILLYRAKGAFFRYGRVPRWWYQRIKRGYSDEDLWGWDCHNALVNAAALRQLADIAHGWPGEPMTFEEWQEILRKMARGFEAHVEMVSSGVGDEGWEEYAKRQEALRQEFKEGMALYAEWYGALWD